jgi:tetratricopeptide (TPR) repeat protein
VPPASSPEATIVDLMKISAEEFVGRLVERPPHTQHALLLGAGCSVTSGIPAAGALVADTWLPRLHRYRCTDGAHLPDWAARVFPGYDPNAPALSYGPVMEALFPLKHDKQKEVERICRNHDPGFGCCVLAKLIERASPDFNVILTTNFDDLVADALYLFTASRPLVIPHAALAGFMRPDFERPLVVKLHGDHQLEPLNTKEELAALNASVCERLQSLLQQRGLIVMGYAGNDNSVMDALEALPDDTLGPGVWWVARSAPNDRVLRWLRARKGCWVESADFDQLMLLVQQHFDLQHPELARWERLQTNYFEALSSLRAAVERLPESEPSAPALKEASAQSVQRIPDWWQVELRARPLKESDPDAADAIYRDGLERIPNSAELLGNYANFLTDIRKDHDGAEDLYRRAIEIDPTANKLGNYALFLTDIRKDHDGAEDLYRRAIDADPANANNLGNYARHLICIDDPAGGVAIAERALELAGDMSELLLELWFYLYANAPEARRKEALTEEKRLLAAGARSPGWDLSCNVARAIEQRHPEGEWLPRLAAVLADEAPITTLDDWEAWRAA